MTVYSVIQKEWEWAWKRDAKAYFARARKNVLLETRAVRSQKATCCAGRCLGYIFFAACHISKCRRHYELAHGCAWKRNLERHIL